MVIKVFYTIEYNSISHVCQYDIKDYELGKDNKTLYYRDQLAFTDSSILPELLYHRHHITSDGSRIIDGKVVQSICNVYFVKL